MGISRRSLGDYKQPQGKISLSIGASNRVMQAWLKQRDLHPPELVLENGSDLSRTEAISARHLNDLLITASQLLSGDLFVQSLPLAGDPMAP